VCNLSRQDARWPHSQDGCAPSQKQNSRRDFARRLFVISL
jgi:hypothetical protein